MDVMTLPVLFRTVRRTVESVPEASTPSRISVHESAAVMFMEP